MSSMVPKLRLAKLQDVPGILLVVAAASRMVERELAALRDVPIMPRKEEYVYDMGQTVSLAVYRSELLWMGILDALL